MTRSARPSWRPRAAAGFSANTPSATATPTPAWCSTRWRGSRKPSPRRSSASRPPKPARPRRWPRSARAVDEAQAAAAAAVDGLALEENLAPVRKGARIIREISWRWREIGADGRICDLLDSQVAAIDAACGKIAPTSPAAALSAAFDLIEARIAGLDDGDRSRRRPPRRLRRHPRRRIGCHARRRGGAGDIGGRRRRSRVAHAGGSRGETAEAAAPAGVSRRANKPPMRPLRSLISRLRLLMRRLKRRRKSEAADAHDEAVLDMIALEMAAPDPADIDDAPGASAMRSRRWRRRRRADPAVAQPEPVAAPEPGRSRSRQRLNRHFNRRSTPLQTCRLNLRSARRLIASGIVHKPQALGVRSAGADPAHEPGREDRVLLVIPIPKIS